MVSTANLPVVNGGRWRMFRVRPIEQLPPVIGLREGISPVQVAGRIGVPVSELAGLGITNYSINLVKLGETLTKEIPAGFEMRKYEARSVDNAARAITGMVGAEATVLELDLDKAVDYLKTLDKYEDSEKRHELIYQLSYDDNPTKHLQNVIALTQKLFPYEEGDVIDRPYDVRITIINKVYAYNYVAKKMREERNFEIRGTALDEQLRKEQLSHSLTIQPEGVWPDEDVPS